MASLARCSSCRGFLPVGVTVCPNCGASEPASTLAERLGLLLKVTGGASVAMTLIACYGVPYDPNDPTDTDPTEGTSVSAGETEPATGSTGSTNSTGSTGAAETTAGPESSSGAESTGASESGGSESGSSDGSSTGGGAVDQPSLPR